MNVLLLLFGVAGGVAAGYLVRLLSHGDRGARDQLKLKFELVERAKKELETVFDTLNELVLITGEDNRVRRVNGAFARAFNLHPRELVGRSLESIFEKHSEKWLSKERYGEIEDSVFKTLFEVTRVSLGEQLILVARDVGSQRRLFTQLVQSDKMATIGVLAAGVAHEINNPAAYVTTNLHELQRYLVSYEKAFLEVEALLRGESTSHPQLDEIIDRNELGVVRREAPDLIGESIEGMSRIRSIVSTLQSICRKDFSQTEESQVRLDQVVEAVVKTAAPHLRSWGGSLQVSTPEATWVKGQRGQLVQVLLNLVVNAIQAKDGVRPNRVGVELLRENAKVIIRITDTGKGVTLENQKKLFEPFFTTKPEGLGTGLGLSISRDIVLAHGGTIDLESAAGEGTKVTLSFPALNDEDITEVEVGKVQEPILNERRLKVLIVDDEPNLLRALERTLARQHTISVAVDGESALREMTSNRYDVILCDLSMPGMDGLELHRRVVDLDPQLASRFLFFTGQPMTENLATRIGETGVQALQKPLDVKDLSARLLQV